MENNTTLEKEINERREELNKIFQELKQKSEEKRNTSKFLGETAAKLIDLRTKRKELVDIAKTNKAERDKLKENVRNLVGKLKESKQEKKKFEYADDSRELSSRIKKIEWKIQTEVISYDKERELTKVRKELENKLKTAVKKDELRKNEFSTRSEIANRIFEEQLKHENVVKFSNDSEKIRQEITFLSQKMAEGKEKITTLNTEITALKSKIDEIKAALNEKSSKIVDDQMDKAKKELKEKFKAVKEKFSKSKKLTSEDILILQSAPEEISL